MSHGGPGPKCRTCGATEARCAFLNGCCGASCSHFGWLDANGNERVKEPVVVRIDERPWCPTCGRRVSSRGRFDCPGVCADMRRAYDREKQRRYQQARYAGRTA